jgi:hypothetical protein
MSKSEYKTKPIELWCLRASSSYTLFNENLFYNSLKVGILFFPLRSPTIVNVLPDAV